VFDAIGVLQLERLKNFETKSANKDELVKEIEGKFVNGDHAKQEKIVNLTNNRENIAPNKDITINNFVRKLTIFSVKDPEPGVDVVKELTTLNKEIENLSARPGN